MNFKKFVAREMLILLGCGLTLLSIYGIVTIQNKYATSKKSAYNDRCNYLKDSLNSLPNSNALKTYNQVKKDFYKFYLTTNDTLIVTADLENDLKKRHNDGVLIEPVEYYFPSGKYQTFITAEYIEKNFALVDGKNLIYPDGEIEEDMSDNRSITYRFANVGYSKFMNLLDDVAYSYKLYQTYRTELNLNSFKEFKDDIKNSRGYNDEVRQLRISLQKELNILNNNYSSITEWDAKEVILNTIIALLFIAYIFRALYLITVWAIKTVRTN